MENVGLHQLRFYPRHVPLIDHPEAEKQNLIPLEYIDGLTKKLFNLPLEASFVKLKDSIAGKRKYRNIYSSENSILLLVGDYTARYPISIEINGSAFDSGLIDTKHLAESMSDDFVVSAIHAKIDTDETPFKELFRCYQAESVQSKTSLRSDRQSNSKTLYFGAKQRQYCIYESDKIHADIPAGTCRHELRFTRSDAAQFFSEWREDQENLSNLIRSHIVGTFGVQFKDHKAADKNLSRREPLRSWEKWLASSEPKFFKPETAKNKHPERKYQIWRSKLLQLKIQLGAKTFDDLLAQVSELYRHEKIFSIQEVQPLLPL